MESIPSSVMAERYRSIIKDLKELKENVDNARYYVNKTEQQIKVLEDYLVHQIDELHPQKSIVHEALLPQTYRMNIEQCSDILIDYIRNAKKEYELKEVGSTSIVTIDDSPLGMLWRIKAETVLKNTNTSKEVITAEEIVQSSRMQHLLHDKIISGTWAIEPILLNITKDPELMHYFGDGTKGNENEFERMRARYLLLVELIRWSVINQFENGSQYTKRVADTKQIDSMIYPSGLLKQMRLNKEKTKSVKVESFRTHMLTRVKRAKVLTQAETVHTAPGSLKFSPHIVDPQKAPRHGDGSVYIGAPKNSLTSDTATNSQTIFSAGIYIIRVGLLDSKGNKKAIFRMARIGNDAIQRENGIIWASIVRGSLYDTDTASIEEFTYEQWMGMKPTEAPVNDMEREIRKAGSSLLDNDDIQSLYKNPACIEMLTKFWKEGNKK